MTFGRDQTMTLAPKSGFWGYVSAGACILALLGYILWTAHHTALGEARLTTANLANTLAAIIEGELSHAEGDLRVIVREITPSDLIRPVSPERRQTLEADMANNLRLFPAVLTYRIFDADGLARFGAGPGNPHMPLRVDDRPWFRTLLSHPALSLVLSDVLISRATGDRIIIMAVPLRDGAGRLYGVVNAALNLAQFREEIQRLGIGRDELVALRRTDTFRLVLRRPDLSAAEPADPPPDGDNPLRRDVLAGRPAAQGVFVSPLDHVRRFYAFRALERYPLAVVVGLSVDDVLRTWRKQAWMSACAALLLATGLVLLYRRDRHSRATLHRAAQRYQALMATASDGIHICDGDGALLEASRSFYALLGYDPDQPPPLHVQDWDCKFSGQDLPDFLDSLICRNDDGLFETRFLRRDGRILDVEVSTHALQVEGHTLLYASARDITRRKQAERDRLQSESDLRATSARLALVLQNAAEGILCFDDQWRVIFTSPAAAAILGWPSQEEMQGQIGMHVTGHLTAEGIPVVPESCALCHDVLNGATRRVRDEFFTRRDGTVIPVEYVISPLSVADVVVGAVLVFHDITELKALETDLRRSNAELEQFAYVASHDLRQPLRMITSYLALLARSLEGRLDEDQTAFLGFASDGARRLDLLIQGLLDYSRVGRVGERALVSLSACLDEVLQNLALSVAENSACIRLDPGLPTVFGNPLELMRLFQNLIGNALKYHAPDRPPQVRVSWRDLGRMWEITVSDNGIGIASDERERAFQPFQRLVPSSQVEGTGIGLAICRKIVETAGGRIWITDPTEGPGSVFHVTLPQVRPAGSEI